MKHIEDMTYQELIAERNDAIFWYNANEKALRNSEEGSIDQKQDEMAEYNKIILETTKRLQEFDAIPYYKRQNDK